MTTKPLQTFLDALKPHLTDKSAIGQHLSTLTYRDPPPKVRGLFTSARAVVAAVQSTGGGLSDARAWTTQAVNWLKTGKAIEQKFVRYEMNASAAAAMAALLEIVRTLPDDPLKPQSSPFGSRPALPTPPPQAPSQSARSLFGSRPPGPSPFGSFGARQPELPPTLAACFDALAVQSDPPSPDASWLDALTAVPADTTPLEWPTDLAGLTSRLLSAPDQDTTTELLRRIGALNDPRAIDHLYALARDIEDTDILPAMFGKMGGDVGVAGLFSLLPVNAEQRDGWLGWLAHSVDEAKQPLSKTHLEALRRVALAQCDPEIAFSKQAFLLMGALHPMGGAALLLKRLEDKNEERRCEVLRALVRFDLTGLMLVHTVRTIHALSQAAQNELLKKPLRVGIQFEQLAALLLVTPFVTMSGVVLALSSHIKDTRTAPLLIANLRAELPEARAAALTHLTRLKATVAADAIVEVMDADPLLREQAAETLCAWGDPRGVPILLLSTAPLAECENIEALIRRFDALDAPAYREWLADQVRQMLITLTSTEANETSNGAAGKLVELIGALTKFHSYSLDVILQLLSTTQHPVVRQRVVAVLPMLKTPWAQATLYKLLGDSVPQVAYSAACVCDAGAVGQALAKKRRESDRLLAVRVLYNAKDGAALIACLASPSAVVRGLAIIALGELHTIEAVEALRQIVHKQDRFDEWGQNLAVLAWRAMAKMGRTDGNSQ